MTRNTTRLVFFTCLLLLTNTLQAQLDAFLKNEAISWAATFETDLCFDLDAQEQGGNRIDLRHFIAAPGPPTAYNGLWMRYWLFSHLENLEVPLFADPELKQPLNEDDSRQVLTAGLDTLAHWDPVTLEQRMALIRTSITADNIQYFRTRQLIFKDDKTGELHTRLLAIAPLYDTNNPDDNPSGVALKPLAWMAMNGEPGTSLQYGPPFTWSATAYAILNLKRLNTIKGQFNWTQFIRNEALGGTRKVIPGSEAFDGEYILEPEEIQEIMTPGFDTIVTFHPKTYEETVQIKERKDPLAQLHQVRLVQDWFYDPKLRLFVNRLRALAPMVDMYDQNDNFRYSKPLFYLRF